MSISFKERVVSILSYCTFGIFSLVWIVYANLTKERISPFLNFNLYQAIFISVVLAVLSLLYGIAIDFLQLIPFVGKLAHSFNVFFNLTPLYFGCTISGFLVSFLVLYLSLMSLFGKRAYLPMVSDVIKNNFGV